MTFKTIVEEGQIPEGSILIWRRRIAGTSHIAKVVDGMILTSDGVFHKSPSGAARHLNGGKPVDGWKVWRVENSGSLIDSLRKSTN